LSAAGRRKLPIWSARNGGVVLFIGVSHCYLAVMHGGSGDPSTTKRWEKANLRLGRVPIDYLYAMISCDSMATETRYRPIRRSLRNFGLSP
jgi:hypothetical protein